MTDHEALLAAAEFIGSDGGELDSNLADEVAATLRRIAADYEITESCGDVFEDLGITKPIEAEAA